ncbi:hypothetical protein NEF87_002764 [Candidatus Lokiarchaeum ossiferum]|uniref:Uncharacterized protein n=1 Tax=Candidatus Lokiarchaeum ossiferum TaxID=2951803 RepID=A0ABY6HSJ4_9ARCH|nr:hypothetical protein NEF87_002764 [Candidatus Lokiarchaeum sp. B-35]
MLRKNENKTNASHFWIFNFSKWDLKICDKNNQLKFTIPQSSKLQITEEESKSFSEFEIQDMKSNIQIKLDDKSDQTLFPTDSPDKRILLIDTNADSTKVKGNMVSKFPRKKKKEWRLKQKFGHDLFIANYLPKTIQARFDAADINPYVNNRKWAPYIKIPSGYLKQIGFLISKTAHLLQVQIEPEGKEEKQPDDKWKDIYIGAHGIRRRSRVFSFDMDKTLGNQVLHDYDLPKKYSRDPFFDQFPPHRKVNPSGKIRSLWEKIWLEVIVFIIGALIGIILDFSSSFIKNIK